MIHDIAPTAPIHVNRLAVAHAPAQPPTPAPAPAPTPAKGLRKVQLGGIATKKEETKTAYPVLDHPGVQPIVDSIIVNTKQLEALEGAIALDKAELNRIAAPFYLPHCSGKTENPSSLSCKSSEGQEILVTFVNRYKAADEEKITALLGEEFVGNHFRQKLALKIDGDLIPEPLIGTIIEQLQELFTRHGCIEAITATPSIQPNKEFHARRHTLLDAATNQKLEAIYPMGNMIKTKGRGSKQD